MYDLEGHFLELFNVETISELEKQLQTPQGGINSCLNSKQLSVNGRQFRRLTDVNPPLTKIGNVSTIKIGHSYKPVHKYYKGKYICTYENGKKAAFINDLDESGISRCCNGLQTTSGRYEWKFAENEFVEA